MKKREQNNDIRRIHGVTDKGLQRNGASTHENVLTVSVTFFLNSTVYPAPAAYL